MNRRTFARRALAVGAVPIVGCVDGSNDGTGTDTNKAGTANADEDGAGYDDTETADGGTDSRDGPTETPSKSEPADAETTAASGSASGIDWPTFGADDGHTGFRPEGDGPANGSVLWSAIGDAPTVLCSPTVRDGVVYTGSAANAVHAFDVESGDSLWTHETTSYVETAPAVRDGRVYTADTDGVVYALTTDGEAGWRHESGQNLHSRSLVVRNGTVFVGTAGDMPHVVSGETDASKAGKVLAIDADSGEEMWSFEGPEDWFTGTAVGDDRVYVGNRSGAVFGLDLATGEQLWAWSGEGVSADASVLAPPTYADGSLYVGVHADGVVAAIDAATGDGLWTAHLEAENVKSSPAVTEDRVYVGSHRARVARLDRGGTETESAGTATPESGLIGRLYALDREDGSEDWVHETDHDFRSSPAVVGDRVYVGGGDGALAVARDDGTEQWRVAFDDYVDSSPAVADGRLFIGSADGSLYCVGDE